MLMDRQPSMLLPSHGEPMGNPAHALGLLAERMGRYVDSRRRQPWDLRSRLDDPYTKLTEHLLMNRTSTSCGYVLLSETGAALLFDYGYDMTTGLPSGNDRASRRPWLGSLPALRRGYGVTTIEAALPTHYHDDHVAGMNLLRAVEGTQIWAPENVAPVLERPAQQDLPCLWYDPIPVDRRLALGMSFTWHEYEITVHELPGHTLYAAAYEFAVDGVKVLVTGDQQVGSFVAGEQREVLNYQYRNRFRPEDYRASAALYRRVSPGLIVSGHWGARWVDEAYLSTLEDEGEKLVAIHHELLPLDELDLGADGVLARITPYYCRAAAGSTVGFTVSVRNPEATEAKAAIRPILPPGWAAEPDAAVVPLPPSGSTETSFVVKIPGHARHRVGIAVELVVGGLRLGQHAEALVDIVETGQGPG
jgi:glyoxylase-like metal-dependent hydrolase (beta-lactamase superfamily II)